MFFKFLSFPSVFLQVLSLYDSVYFHNCTIIQSVFPFSPFSSSFSPPVLSPHSILSLPLHISRAPGHMIFTYIANEAELNLDLFLSPTNSCITDAHSDLVTHTLNLAPHSFSVHPLVRYHTYCFKNLSILKASVLYLYHRTLVSLIIHSLVCSPATGCRLCPGSACQVLELQLWLTQRNPCLCGAMGSHVGQSK